MLRAVLNVVSMLAFFVGLSMTPLARATALTFTAPLFTALFSALFLGEIFRWRRWTAIFVGFFGALVILRPGAAGVRHRRAAGARLLAAVGMAHDRHQGAGPHRVRRLTITVYVTVLLIPMTLVPAVLVWETPGLDMWGWLVFIGVIGTLGQIVVTEAVKLADMTVLMPFDFLKLVWAAFLGIIFFAEVPDVLTWVGGAIVFGSSFYIAWREAKLRKAKVARAPLAPRERALRQACASSRRDLALGWAWVRSQPAAWPARTPTTGDEECKRSCSTPSCTSSSRRRGATSRARPGTT